MDLLRSGRRKSAEFQTTLRHLLVDAIQKRNSPLEKFVPREKLAQIWTPQRLEGLLQYLKPGFSRSFIPIIQQEFLQTISILVSIDWDGWSQFTDIFLQHVDWEGNRDRTDANIPEYSLDLLEHNNFLGPEWGAKFLDNQYTFCPIDIREGENLVRSREWRLPFLDGKSEVLGYGGYGHVTKEVIPASHFIPRKGISTSEVAVARKVFISRGDFHKETRNLNMIRDSLSQHDRVVLHIATVAVGNEFNLLSPRADTDLEKFLRGEYLQPSDCNMGDLIQEAANLADALEHLHERLQVGHPLRFCHRDLKPANILVYLDSKSRNYPRVGKWKITDFGLSVITRLERHPKPFEEFVTETISQSMPGVEGAYQAPEVCDGNGSGSLSDVWSFGCILVRILAFKLDGVDGLAMLDYKRGKDADGFSDYENDYFNRGSPRVLNPHIEDWIKNLPYQHPDYPEAFLICARDMLLKILKVRRHERSTANEVKHMLQELKSALYPRLELAVRQTSSDSSMNSSNQQEFSIGRISKSRGSSLSYPSYHRPSDASRGTLTATPEILVHEINSGKVDRVRTVLNGNVDVEERYDGERPLIHAIQRNFHEAIEVLLSYALGLDLESHDSKGNTPLGLAVHQENYVIVEQLLKSGAPVDGPSTKGMTPLMIAARQGNGKLFELLLLWGANCKAYSNEGLTCLHYATYSQRGAPIINLLRSELKTVDIPKRGTNEEMPFLTLVKNFVDTSSWWEKFQALLEGGADIDKADANGITPLKFAVEEQYPDLTRALLRYHASMENLPRLDSLRSDMKQILKNARGTHLRQRSHDSSKSKFSIGGLLRK